MSDIYQRWDDVFQKEEKKISIESWITKILKIRKNQHSEENYTLSNALWKDIIKKYILLVCLITKLFDISEELSTSLRSPRGFVNFLEKTSYIPKEGENDFETITNALYDPDLSIYSLMEYLQSNFTSRETINQTCTTNCRCSELKLQKDPNFAQYNHRFTPLNETGNLDFYDRENFSSLFNDLKWIENSLIHEEILEEYYSIARSEYIEGPGETFEPKLGGGVEEKWQHFWLLKGDDICYENSFLCPFTSSILLLIPRLRREAFFSTLLPGAFIPPHMGDSNLVLRVQFGLCGLSEKSLLHVGGELDFQNDEIVQVGGEKRQVKEAELTIFDDSKPHSAWNRHSSLTRTVLIFDIIRPELTDHEFTTLCGVIETTL